MISLTFPDSFFSTYLYNLEKSVTLLNELYDYVFEYYKANNSRVPEYYYNLINRVWNDILKLRAETQGALNVLRKGVEDAEKYTPPITNASTTPTVAGGTPNAKNNNSAFLWALAAIGGIGLFSALSTGKRK